MTGWAVQGSAELSTLVTYGAGGKLVYTFPHKIPDYSCAGYALSTKALPTQYPVKAVVEPNADPNVDMTSTIQAAINAVSLLTPNSDNIRGAVYLRRGFYKVSSTLVGNARETLKITTSGVILKGDGMGSDGTILYQSDPNNCSTVKVGGWYEVTTSGTAGTISAMDVGSRTVTLSPADAALFTAPSQVQIRRPANSAWITSIGMEDFWPGPVTQTDPDPMHKFEIPWIRNITAKSGNQLTFDAPITSSIQSLTPGIIEVVSNDPRIFEVGIEDIVFISAYNSAEVDGGGYYNDEDHGGIAIDFQSVKDCWVRRCAGFYYAWAFVQARRMSSRVTVEDCAMFDGVSLDTPFADGGGREYYFNMEGCQHLVQRCFAREARHAFTPNSARATTDVFLDCYAIQSNLADEPHQRWSSAILYDNHYTYAVLGLAATASDHGHKCVNSMAWNCEIHQPTGALNLQISRPKDEMENNWAVGNLFINPGIYANPPNAGTRSVDAHIESNNVHVEPRSLFLAQLNDRNADYSKNIITRSQLSSAGAYNSNLKTRYQSVPDFLTVPTGTVNTATVTTASNLMASLPSTFEAKVTGVKPYAGGSNIIALWHFDEDNATSPRDYSAPAKPVPAPTPPTVDKRLLFKTTNPGDLSSVDGLFGNALTGFATPGYDNVCFMTQQGGVPNPATQTFECWVKFPDSALLPHESMEQFIMARRGGAGVKTVAFYFVKDASNVGWLKVDVRSTAGVTKTIPYQLGATTVVKNKWYHIAYSLEPEGANLRVKIYLQEKDRGVYNPGTAVNWLEPNFTYDSVNMYNISIGEDGATNPRGFSGIIDEVRYRDIASGQFETFGRANPSNYTTPPSGNDLIARWTMDNLTDSGPNGYTLSEINPGASPLVNVNAIFSKGYDGFDNTLDNHCLKTASGVVPNPPTQSLETWVYFDSNALLPNAKAKQHIFARHTGSDPLNFYFEKSGSDGLLTLEMRDSGGNIEKTSFNVTAIVKVNTWYRVAYSIEPVGADLRVKLYLSEKGLETNIPVTSRTILGFTYDQENGTGYAVIGEDDHTTDTTFTGMIDEVRYRNTAGF